MQEIKFKKGNLIFAEGAVEYFMFCIATGKVGIYSGYETKDEKLLVELQEGAFFGELGMMERLPRSATAVALENTTVYKIDDDNFDEFCKAKPAKVIEIMQNTSRRMRSLTKDYLFACNALNDYVKAKEHGEEISDELKSKMKKIAGVGKKK